MLDNMPDKVLKNMVSLKNDKRFEEFVQYLNDQAIKMAFTSTTMKEEVLSRWYQGASQVLSNLIEQIAESRETLDNIESATRSTRSFAV